MQNGGKAQLSHAPSGSGERTRWQHFNKLIRGIYAPKRHPHDLATVETELLSRARCEGHACKNLNPILGSDGEHVNTKGARPAAKKTLGFTAKLP